MSSSSCQAHEFLEACASGGATHVYLTYRPLEPLDAEAVKTIKSIGRGYHSIATALDQVQAWIARGTERQESVILRPCGDVLRILSTIDARGKRHQNVVPRPYDDPCAIMFFQLDDVGDRSSAGARIEHSDERTAALVERLRPATRFRVRTSPTSQQLWIAIRKNEFTSDADRLAFRAALVAGCSAEVPASGAVRVPGSINFKAKYAEDHGEEYGVEYPVVQIEGVQRGTIARRAMFEELGFVAKAVSVPASVKLSVPGAQRLPTRATTSNAGHKLPDYDKCLAFGRARNDRSAGDVQFATYAAWRGFSEADVAREIARLSPKYRDVLDERGESSAARYVERQAARGAAIAAKYPNPTPFKGSRMPQNTRHAPARSEILPAPVMMGHGRATDSSVATVAPPTEIAPLPARRAASSEPGRDQIFATEGAVGSRTLAFTSSREDARALGAVGVPAVSLGSQFPPWLRARTALRRVVVATRPDEAGQELARKLIATCTLARLAYVPFPVESDEATLLATFSAFVEQRQQALTEVSLALPPRPLPSEDIISASPAPSEEPILAQALPDFESLATGSLEVAEVPSAGLFGYADEILASGLDGYGVAEYEQDLRIGWIALPGVAEPGAGRYDGVTLCYDRATFSAARCSWPDGITRAEGLDESLFPMCRARFKGNSYSDLFHRFAIHVAVVHRAISYGIGRY